ncbi:MAG: hypothetical protein Q4F72_03025 [Desulfovibrionaceae bacterium]|nr:hypothetical protein [Desulfovibrionaceae bacterium]
MAVRQIRDSILNQTSQSISAVADRLIQPLARACANIFDAPLGMPAKPAPVWASAEERRPAPAVCRIERF